MSTVFSAVDNFGSSSFKESHSKNAEAFLNLPGHSDQQEASADNSFHQHKSLCNIPLTFLVACIVSIWIICNEIISILENIKDMGVNITAFLQPLVEHVKSQVEDKVNIDNKKDEEGK